jgi:hypothetical protein
MKFYCGIEVHPILRVRSCRLYRLTNGDSCSAVHAMYSCSDIGNPQVSAATGALRGLQSRIIISSIMTRRSRGRRLQRQLAGLLLVAFVEEADSDFIELRALIP